MRYGILNNGGYPYEVDVLPNVLSVYKFIDYDEETGVRRYEEEPMATYEPHHVFLGENFANEWTIEDWGGPNVPPMLGNTMLLDMGDLRYIHIGAFGIKYFFSLSPIVEYRSMVLSCLTPSPYAIDEIGRAYIMDNQVILNAIPEGTDNPVKWYHENAVLPGHLIIEGSDVLWDHKYRINPAEDYASTEQIFGHILGIQDDEGHLTPLTVEAYVALIEDWAAQKGFTPIDMILL